jgi:hypothetical protein
LINLNLPNRFVIECVPPRSVKQGILLPQLEDTANVEYDVLLSYRVNSDLENAEGMFSTFDAAGLKVVLTMVTISRSLTQLLQVWWDMRTLRKSSRQWEEGIFEGMRSCRIFMPLISRFAVRYSIFHLNIPTQSVII